VRDASTDEATYMGSDSASKTAIAVLKPSTIAQLLLAKARIPTRPNPARYLGNRWAIAFPNCVDTYGLHRPDCPGMGKKRGAMI